MTARAAQSQRIVRAIGKRGVEVECLNCWTRFSVDAGDDGDGEVDQVPCEGSDNCTVMLCPACKTTCPLCGNATCLDHVEEFQGERMCECCRKEQSE